MSVAVLVRCGLLAMALACAIALPERSAHAHASLVESGPADGTALAKAPAEIVLRFDEAVTPVAFRLIGPDGRQLRLPGEPVVIDRAVRIPLPSGLSNGGYLLSWRIISADAHPVGGTLAFAIGTSPPASAKVDAAQAARERWWQSAAMVNRAIGDFALLFVAGGALFAVLVLRGRIPDKLPLRPMGAIAACLGIVSMIAAVAITGGWLMAAPASAAFDLANWRAGAATNTALRSAVGCTGLVLAAIATFALPGRAARIIAVVGALCAAGSLALSGHVASLDPAWPGQLALALHAILVAFWIGSLWPLRRIVGTQPAEIACVIVKRFSAIAVPAVAVLAVAGLGVALTRVQSADALVATMYGRILILKLAFVAMMIVLAIRNRRSLTPALAAGKSGAGPLLARNIGVEIGFAGVVLLLTAILGHTPPGQGVGAEHDHNHDARAAGFSVVTYSRGHMLLLEIAPARPGANGLVATITTPDGQPIAGSEVTAALSLPDAGIEPLVRPMRPVRAGTFALDRVDLPLAGRWHVQIDALLGEFEKLIFTTEVPIR